MPNNGISETNDNKNSKPRKDNILPQFVIFTYSVSPDLKDTLFSLNTRGASVHFIIDEDGKQIQFTNDLTQQTFCCGLSKHNDQTSLNQTSINVMFINDAMSAFKPEQISKSIKFLQDIAQRYPYMDLKRDLLGLGEVAISIDENAPSGEGKVFPRHQAPGKFFFWQELAEQGFGLFCPATTEQKAEICISPCSSKEEILTLQENLQEYGYPIESSGIYDAATKAWVTRFNERYVPSSNCDDSMLQNADPSLWSKASQLNLQHILDYINSQKNTLSQSTNFQTSFFNHASSTADNSIDEAAQQTVNLNLK